MRRSSDWAERGLLALHVAEDKAKLGIEWFEKPAEAAMTRAETLLHDLGAIHDHRLTPIGMKMSAFPTHPGFARDAAGPGR